MDPNAALNDLITSVINGEFADAADRLNDLRRWRDNGGFAPKDPREGSSQQPGVDWQPTVARTRSVVRQNLAHRLRAAGWYAVAADVDDGVPLRTILGRLNKMSAEGEDMGEAEALVSDAAFGLPPTP